VLLRHLPQVEQVLNQPGLMSTRARVRRDVVKRLAQEWIAALRHGIETGELKFGSADEAEALLSADTVASAVAGQLTALHTLLMQPVVNATGVVLHTNLGRAMLSPAAQQHVADIAASYCDLEVDLASGDRSKRDATCAQLLQALFDRDATVVNNCAGALFLTLHALASGREVITSRGELVEIGGSFRVPDIVRASGCKLVEVGTTNRTRLRDYEQAITENTALILKTHRSNFSMSGFVEETSVAELARLGNDHSIPVVYDLGSGYVGAQDENFDEPEVHQALANGASLVLFSGDKLFGGPQAGIAVGDQWHVAALRKSPLWRAFRCDKLALAALDATLLEHLSGRPQSPSHPANVLARVGHTEELANELAAAIRGAKPEWKVEVINADGSWGGGSRPDEVIPSHAVVIEAEGLKADKLDEKLRTGSPAVLGYKLSGRFALNVLALLDGDVERSVEALQGV
jgi:L-seryl-tRNA(Ser) seleniumtransferase